MEKKLNLGCGAQTPENWINVDYALGAKFAKIPLFNKLGLTNIKWNPKVVIHNLVKPFPWKTESIDVVYSSHTLEHFTREDGYRFLTESYRVLKPGGIIRIVVPDLKVIVNAYSDGEIPADHFIESLLVLYPAQNGFIKKLLMPIVAFPHKCMYDTEALVKILEKIGFKARGKMRSDSSISDLDVIEIPSRTENAVIVEGIK